MSELQTEDKWFEFNDPNNIQWGDKIFYINKIGDILVYKKASPIDVYLENKRSSNRFVQSLIPIIISECSGFKRIVGYRDSYVSLQDFSVSDKSIEELIVSDVEEKMVNKFSKPKYSTLFKRIRHQGKVLLPVLIENWDDKINWKETFKMIRNCPFVPMKIIQLVYCIITNSLFDGGRLKKMNKNNTQIGHCNCCDKTATIKHMFSECKITKAVWDSINEFGKIQWDNYTDFDYNNLPHLLKDYTTSNLLKVSTVWTLWTIWCQYFYDQKHSEETFFDLALNTAIEQFIKRSYEMPNIVQWLQIVSDRRTNDNNSNITEKEFLLSYAQ